ncbi:single-stranded DNA-binding protein [Pediococcus pentosaceus]|uniref:single-stranded DNA-binding protein n=1 Tax=Pediococcus pentosaceus TaxID=1255 RepID=UPI00256FEFD2|nr:single-stranded DNA-binding protein [Pediococcus pentosaceus]
MINRTVLVGRLTKDPELRYTGSGTAVATFTIAVNRQFTNSNGKREADFINCVIWHKYAESFCNFTHKGSLVGIDGRIQTRSYDNKQGQRVFITEVVAENFSLLESKNSNQNSQNKQSGQSSPSKNPNNAFNSMPDIKDDDLPF